MACSIHANPLRPWLRGIPPACGRPIRVEFQPALTASRRKLWSGRGLGMPVHAATFIRTRRIILDAELKDRPRELRRILAHEIFHFAWVRLGNSKRQSYETLLEAELRRRVRGELGWSAEVRKRKLAAADRRKRTRRWRAYCCESFCDSAAWLFAGPGRHDEFTLPPRHRAARRRWFLRQGIRGGISI